MNVTKLDRNHYEKLLQLSSYAFQYKMAEDELEKRTEQLDQLEMYGVFDGDVLASKLHIIPFNIWLNEQKVKMGGIAGVATYPEYRRNGYVAGLIKHSLASMRKQEQLVSMLHPFSVSFYRRYGWEMLSNYTTVHLTKADLKKTTMADGTIKRFMEEAPIHDLEEVYNTYANQFIGMLDRTHERWKTNKIKDLAVAIYYNPEQLPQGYMIYEMKDEKMRVEEFIVNTHEARTGLWNYICQHDSMLKELEMYLEDRDPLLFHILDPKGRIEKRGYAMVRIVDVLPFLKVYPFQWGQGDSINLCIEDEHAPWNNGTFTISSNEMIKVDSQEFKGLKLTINHLSALLFGSITVQELSTLDSLHGKKEDIETLERILPRKRPFFLDFF